MRSSGKLTFAIMAEHLSAQHIARYRVREMSSEELLAADDHIAACEVCRQQLGEGDQLTAVYQSFRADLRAAKTASDHLSYEQLIAYVGRRLDEVEYEIVKNHLLCCRQCANEAHDLNEFTADIVNFTDQEQAPDTRLSLKGRIRSLFHLRYHHSSLRFAGIAAFLVLALGLMWLWLRPRMLKAPGYNPPIAIDFSLTPQPVPSPQVKNLPSPIMLALLKDGDGEISLDDQGRLSVPKPLHPSYQQVIKAALATQRVDAPKAIAELNDKPGRLMGGPNKSMDFALLSPVGTVVETERPVFRWRPLNRATSYRVAIYDADFNEVAASGPLSGDHWQITRGLERGSVYSWQVTATRDGQEIAAPTPPTPKPKFKVLEQGQANELDRARENYKGSHLILGVLYQRAGLLDRAESEFQALLDANPQSGVAERLLRNLRALRNTK